MPEVGREGDQNGGGGESLSIGRRGRVAVSPSRRPGARSKRDEEGIHLGAPNQDVEHLRERWWDVLVAIECRSAAQAYY